MVRILIKRFLYIFSIVLIEFSQIVSMQMLFAPKASAAPTYKVLAASGPSGSAAPRNNSGYYFTYYGYRSQINNINGGWAPRGACNPPDSYATYKTLPWLPDSRAVGTGINGNVATASGDCQSGVTDGGWNNNAWLNTGVQNWAASSNGITLSGPIYSGPNDTSSLCSGSLPCSSKLQYCSAMKGSSSALALPIWGNPSQDNNDHSNNYWTANWGSGTGYSNMFLYSHGVTLVRNNFNLTDQDIANLSSGSNNLYLEVEADDWFRMYLNGVLVSTTPTSNDSTSGGGAYVNISLNAYKSNLRSGENNVAFEVVDKAVWNTSGTAVARGAGMCYSLTLGVSVAVPLVLSCTLSASPSSINAGDPTTLTWTTSNSPTGITKVVTPVTAVTATTGNSTAGTDTYKPTANTNFQYTFTRASYTNAVCNDSVSIIVPPPPPPPNLKLGPWDSITNMPPML